MRDCSTRSGHHPSMKIVAGTIAEEVLFTREVFPESSIWESSVRLQMARKPKAQASAPPAFVLTDEERKKLNDWLARLLVKPVRTQTPTGPFLRWLAKDEDGAVHVYTWTPETAKELAEAEIYYDAAHER